MPNDNVNALKGLNCKIYYGDVTKKETLQEIFNITENTKVFVIHCAAIVYIKSKYNSKVYDVNINGVKNIIEKVLEKNAKLICVSSVHAIPEKPNNEIMKEITDFDPDKVEGQYAKSKAEAAKYVLEMVKSKNLNACIIHPSGIIGPNDFGNSHLTELIKNIINEKLPICVNGGYNFVDVRDVADGIINACDKGIKGQCYILSNQYITIKDLADIVSSVNHTKKVKLIFPVWIVKLLAPFCELYYNLRKQTPLFTRYSLYTLTSNSNFSNEKAKKELNFKNRNLEDTLKDTVKWLKENMK